MKKTIRKKKWSREGRRKSIEIGDTTITLGNGKRRIFIKIGYPHKFMHYSRFVWIANKNTIPKNYIIHHKDGNFLNNKIENLELKSNSEHSRVHSKNRRKCLNCKYFERLTGTKKLKRREGCRGSCKIKKKEISSLETVCKFFKTGKAIVPPRFCGKCGLKEGKNFHNGYCGNCYRKYGKKKIICKKCKKKKVHYAKGMCKLCYEKDRLKKKR